MCDLILQNYDETNCNDDGYMHIKMTGAKVLGIFSELF